MFGRWTGCSHHMHSRMHGQAHGSAKSAPATPRAGWATTLSTWRPRRRCSPLAASSRVSRAATPRRSCGSTSVRSRGQSPCWRPRRPGSRRSAAVWVRRRACSTARRSSYSVVPRTASCSMRSSSCGLLRRAMATPPLLRPSAGYQPPWRAPTTAGRGRVLTPPPCGCRRT